MNEKVISNSTKIGFKVFIISDIKCCFIRLYKEEYQFVTPKYILFLNFDKSILFVAKRTELKHHFLSVIKRYFIKKEKAMETHHFL